MHENDTILVLKAFSSCSLDTLFIKSPVQTSMPLLDLPNELLLLVAEGWLPRRNINGLLRTNSHFYSLIVVYLCRYDEQHYEKFRSLLGCKVWTSSYSKDVFTGSS